MENDGVFSAWEGDRPLEGPPPPPPPHGSPALPSRPRGAGRRSLTPPPPRAVSGALRAGWSEGGGSVGVGGGRGRGRPAPPGRGPVPPPATAGPGGGGAAAPGPWPPPTPRRPRRSPSTAPKASTTASG